MRMMCVVLVLGGRIWGGDVGSVDAGVWLVCGFWGGFGFFVLVGGVGVVWILI